MSGPHVCTSYLFSPANATGKTNLYKSHRIEREMATQLARVIEGSVDHCALPILSAPAVSCKLLTRYGKDFASP